LTKQQINTLRDKYQR